MRDSELLSDHCLACTSVLHRIVFHEVLHIFVSLQLTNKEIIDVGTLHTQCSEDLSTLVEPAPALLREGDADVCGPELLCDNVKVNLLNDLQAELV